MTSENLLSIVPGVEDRGEFDEASGLARYYCHPISVEEFENQAETETEKAISVRAVHYIKFMTPLQQ